MNTYIGYAHTPYILHEQNLQNINDFLVIFFFFFILLLLLLLSFRISTHMIEVHGMSLV